MKFNDEVLQKALDTYGQTSQQVMLFEEMAELQKEVCKQYREKGNKKHLTEEMADVLVMVRQLQIMFKISDSDIQEVIDFKLSRLENRIRRFSK